MKKNLIFIFVFVLIMQSLLPCFSASLPSANVPDGFGVCIRFVGDPTNDLNMIQASGFKNVRTDLTWSAGERQKGVYDFSQYDAIVNGELQRGLRPYLILAYGNQLYESNIWAVTTPQGIQAYANFAAAAAAHYKGKNIIWEIWNEPNNPQFWQPSPNPTQYMALVQAAVPAIKNADPNATVFAPAIAGARTPPDPLGAFPDTCFQLGLANYIDGFSCHPYMELDPEWVIGYYWGTNVYGNLRSLITKYSPNKNIPIISGEWGYPSAAYNYTSGTYNVNATEATQAKYCARMFLMNLYQGIPISMWYDWRDDGQDPTNTNVQYHFGLLRYDNSFKPSYYAVQSLMQNLNGKHFTQRLTSSTNDYLLQFSNGSQTTIAAWTVDPAHSVQINGASVNLTDVPQYIQANTTVTVPAAPSNLAVTGVSKGASTGAYYVNLAWNINSTNQTGFNIFQSINSTSNFTQIATVAANSTTYSYNLGTSPTAGTYYYKIVATNSAGSSQPSNIVSTAINPTTSTSGVPAAPTNLTVTRTYKDVSGNYYAALTWKNNANNQTAFILYASTNPTTGFVAYKVVAGTVTSYIASTKTPGIYYLKVVAANNSGNSAPSNTVSVTLNSFIF